MDTKINLLDTPGYSDFAGDAIAGLAAADGALVAVSAVAGVEVGTERMFREAVERRDPVLFVVTMMDKEHASFDQALRVDPRHADAQRHPGRGTVRRGRGLPRNAQPLHRGVHSSTARAGGAYERRTSRPRIASASTATTASCSRRSRRPTTRCSSATSTAARSRATKKSRR